MGHSLEITRVVPTTPEAAFAAFTDPDELAKWWGPAGFSVPSLDFKPRVGARYGIEMQPPEGERFHLTGEFCEVDPPGRLSFTFAWEPPNPDDVETLAELSFRSVRDSTEIVLAQGVFKTEERLALHRDGWTDSLDRLERLLGP